MKLGRGNKGRLSLLIHFSFLLFAITFYLVIFRSLFYVKAFAIGDTLPSPERIVPYFYSPPFLEGYIYDELNLISLNLGEKIFTVLPFVVGSVSFYFSFNTKAWKRWLLSFIYMLNPGTVFIFLIGDAPGILFSYALLPLVFKFGKRLADESSWRNAFLLAGIIALDNFVYFEGFIFSAIFLFPLLFYARNKLRFIYLSIVALFLGFLTEANFEFLIYLTVVPSFSSSAYTLKSPYFETFYYEIGYISLYLTFYVLYLLKKKGVILPLSLAFTSLVLLTFWSFLFVYHAVNIPFLNTVVLVLTTFQTKFILFINGLIIISLALLKDWKPLLLIIPLISISNYPYITDGAYHYTVYSIFTFNAKEYCVNEGLYNVEVYVYSNANCFFYIGFPQYMEKVDAIKGLFDNYVFLSSFNMSSNPWVKYVITCGEIIQEKCLRLVYSSGCYRVYENVYFKPKDVYVSPCKIAVFENGNSSFFVLPYPYSSFWNASGGNSSAMIIPINKGKGIVVNSEPLINDYLMVVDFIVSIIILLGIVKLKIPKTLS